MMTNFNDEIFLIRDQGYSVALLDRDGFYSSYVTLPYAPTDTFPLTNDRGIYRVVGGADELFSPVTTWSWVGLGQWLTLAYHYARVSLEIGATLYLIGDKVKVILNRQSVTAGSCVRELRGAAYDLAADCQVSLDEFPCPLGTIHSHHTMSITFSPTDDEQGQDLPGVHLLVRNYPRPILDMSVYSNSRYFLYRLSSIGLKMDDLKPRPLTTGLADWVKCHVTRSIMANNVKAANGGILW